MHVATVSSAKTAEPIDVPIGCEFGCASLQEPLLDGGEDSLKGKGNFGGEGGAVRPVVTITVAALVIILIHAGVGRAFSCVCD